MTAMNLIVQPKARAVYLLTDTAVIRKRDGALVDFIAKVVPVRAAGQVVAAIAVSGRLEVEFLKAEMAKVGPSSVQDFLDRFPDVFRRTEAAIMAKAEGGSMAAVVAAFDHSRSLPLGFGIANDNSLFAPSHRPYELKRLAQHITEFSPENVQLRQTDFRDPAVWSPERDGLALIEAQRLDLGFAGERYSIGGKAVLTRLDASGITSKVLKEWPDRIGRPIDPHNRAQATGWHAIWERIIR